MKKSEIEKMIDQYLLEEKLDEKSEKTLKHYEYVIRMFVSSIKNEDITKNDLLKFKEQLMNMYKTKTINNYIVIVNKFIKYIDLSKKDEEFSFYKLKKHNAKDTLKNVKVQQKASLEDVLEPAEFKRMLRMAKKHDQQMYMLMKVLAFTGIRISELKVFTIENLESYYIQVRNKGKTREIILRQDLRRELLKYCKENNITSGYVFQGRKAGSMIHHTTTYNRLKKVAGMCRGIKIEKVHPHSFRHLFAIKFIEEGGDISELADILGHSSIETTRIYVRTTMKMKKERLERMRY